MSSFILRSGVWILAVVCPVFATTAPASLVLDPAQSRVEVVVKATVDSFTATLSTYKAHIEVDSGRVTAATLAFDFADVHTGKAARDEAMNTWQETPLHPKCRFALGSLTADASGRLTAHGTLVLHDVSRELDFPVYITTDQRLYAIDGEAPVDTRDFGLPIIRKFGLLKVAPVVVVRFHLQGAVGVGSLQPSPKR